MKNIIKIDILNPYYYTIENVNDGSNSIWIQFTNYSDTGRCEIYHCDAYYEELAIGPDDTVEIPSQYYCDGSTMHIRYENGVTTGFIHVTGDGGKYNDLVVVKVSDCIATITGNAKITISDYSSALARIISAYTKSNDESCYENLDTLRKSIIKTIREMGGTVEDNATINDISASLIELNIGLDEGMALIAEAITAKGVDTPADAPPETMAENIRKISSGGTFGIIVNTSPYKHPYGYATNIYGVLPTETEVS